MSEILFSDPLVLDYTKSHSKSSSSTVFASPLPLPYSEIQVNELINWYSRKREEIQLLHSRNRRVPHALESEIQSLDLKIASLLTRLGVPLFQKLSEPQILEIGRRMEFRKCTQKQVFWEIRGPVNSAILLVTASCEALADVHGRFVPIAEFQPGRTVGDKYLVDQNETADYKLVCTKPGIYAVLSRELVGLCGYSASRKEIDTHSIMHTLQRIPAFCKAHPAMLKEACKSARLLNLAPGEIITVDLMAGENKDLPPAQGSVLYVSNGLVEIRGRVKVVNKNIKSSLIPIFLISPGEFFGHTEVIFARGLFWCKLQEYIKFKLQAEVQISSIQARAIADHSNTRSGIVRETCVVLFKGTSFDSIVNYPDKAVAKELIPKIDEFVIKYAEKFKTVVQSLLDRKAVVSIDEHGNMITPTV